MSNIELNKKIVVDFFSAFGALDFSALMNLIDENIVFNVSGSSSMSGRYTLQTVGGVSQMISKICPSGVAFEILDLTAEGDRVACRAEGHAEMSGGGVYNNHYHFLLRIRNGKIHEYHEYMDTLLAERIFGSLASQPNVNKT